MGVGSKTEGKVSDGSSHPPRPECVKELTRHATEIREHGRRLEKIDTAVIKIADAMEDQHRTQATFLSELKNETSNAEAATRERVALVEQAVTKAHERIDNETSDSHLKLEEQKGRVTHMIRALWALVVAVTLSLLGWVLSHMASGG